MDMIWAGTSHKVTEKKTMVISLGPHKESHIIGYEKFQITYNVLEKWMIFVCDPLHIFG